MADFKQSNNSVSTFATFLLVIYFIFSSHVDAEVDLLVDPTLIGQELQSFAKDALGVDEMQVSRRLQQQICFSLIATFAVILGN